MNLRQHKGKLAASLVIVSLLFVLVVWSSLPSPPPVRVTFQHATNDAGKGKVGVIALVNNMNEPVTVMGAWYVPAKRNDLSVSLDTPIASIDGDMSKLAAQSTNIALVSIPTNGGTYKLALQYVPDSRSPWQNYGSLQSRSANLVFPWLHPSQKTAIRWFGGSIVASQSIDFSQ